MKKSNIIGLLCIIGFAGLLNSQTAKIRLALTPFDDTITLEGENARIGNVTASVLETSIGGMDNFQVREADAVRGYIKKLELVQVGLAEPETLKIKSTDLAIDYLMVGTASKFGSLYEIDARIIDTSTWCIMYSRGSSAGSISNAVGDILRTIGNTVNREYIKKKNKTDTDKATIAVQNFKDYNEMAQGGGYSGSFSEMMNTGLGGCALVTVVEKKFTDALVNEKSLEMAGIIENEGAGDFLLKGIQYNLTGDIRVFSDVICLNYRIHSIGDGRLIFIGNGEVTGSGAFRPVSRYISQVVEDVLYNKVGSFTVKAKPEGSDLYVDGALKGKAPLTVPVSTGLHEISVKKEGYDPYKTVLNILPKQVNELDVTLAAPKEVVKKDDDEKKKKEADRLAKDKAEKDKAEQEKLAKMKADEEKSEQERIAREKAEQEKIEAAKKKEKARAGNVPTM